jgi:hypothetical protein
MKDINNNPPIPEPPDRTKTPPRLKEGYVMSSLEEKAWHWFFTFYILFFVAVVILAIVLHS